MPIVLVVALGLLIARSVLLRRVRKRSEGFAPAIRALGLDKSQLRIVRTAVNRGELPADDVLRDPALRFAALATENFPELWRLIVLVASGPLITGGFIALLLRHVHGWFEAVIVALACITTAAIAGAIYAYRANARAKALLREHGHGGVVAAEAADGPAAL